MFGIQRSAGPDTPYSRPRAENENRRVHAPASVSGSRKGKVFPPGRAPRRWPLLRPLRQKTPDFFVRHPSSEPRQRQEDRLLILSLTMDFYTLIFPGKDKG